MTTIAYRDGILASDSRVTTKDFVESDTDTKIWRLRDGSLFGSSGDYMGGLILFRSLVESLKAKKFVLPERNLKGTKALFISKQGDQFYFEFHTWELRKDEYLAIGSGGKFALAAMDAGADAKTAVRIGMKRDIYSGGKLRYLELK